MVILKHLLSTGFLTLTAGVCMAATVADRPIVPGGPQTIYAPIAGLSQFKNWNLAVVNRGPKSTPATITVYSSLGVPFTPTEIKLAASETRHLNIKLLVPREEWEHNLGGVAVSFTGQAMGVWAQATLSDFYGFGNVDLPVFHNAMYKSNVADAVWWEPKHAKSYVILGNSSEETLHIEVKVDGKAYKVELGPHATTVREVHGGQDDDHNELNSVHVSSDGPAGTLRVSGYALSHSEGFVNTIRFFDPDNSTEPAVYANGLHFSAGENHLAVKNLSSQPLRIWGTAFPTGDQGPLQAVAIPSVIVAAGEVEELNLSGLGDLTQLDGSAVKIESTGPNASVIASFLNFNTDRRMVRGVPLRDIGDLSVLTGAYPWRLDGQFQSRVYLTNMGTKRAAIGGHILPNGGAAYFIDSHYLDPGETAVFNLRKIRDQQTPDPKGVTLPKDVVAGQFQWSVLFGGESQHFLGRNEVLDPTSGISASFSCAYCSCPYSTTSASLSPGAVTLGINSSFSGISIFGVEVNTCSGAYVDDYHINPPSWSIASPNILSLTTNASPSVVKGLAVGKTSFYAPLSTPVYSYTPNPSGNGGTCFQSNTEPLNPPGNGTVNCMTPTGETSVYVRQVLTDVATPTASDFLQTLQVPANIYTGFVKEQENALGTDSCYFGSADTYGPTTTVTGTTWTVGGVTPGFSESQVVSPGPNQWGPDEIGYLPAPVRYYQQRMLKLGITAPCGFHLYQNLAYACSQNASFVTYGSSISLTSTIDSTGITNCREGVCAPRYVYP